MFTETCLTTCCTPTEKHRSNGMRLLTPPHSSRTLKRKLYKYDPNYHQLDVVKEKIADTRLYAFTFNGKKHIY